MLKEFHDLLLATGTLEEELRDIACRVVKEDCKILSINTNVVSAEGASEYEFLARSEPGSWSRGMLSALRARDIDAFRIVCHS